MIDINICLRVEGARASDVVQAAVACEDAGFAGISISDELCDVAGNGTWSHEPWTLMSAIATQTSRVEIASMVLNVANRDASTTAVAAATLQDLSSGRLLLGLGAGTDRNSIYARDQMAFGRVPGRAPERRAALAGHIAALHNVWDNTSDGFLRPDPVPPVIVGAFGPKTAALAGTHADGIACPIDGFGDHALPIEELVRIARSAFDSAGRTGTFHVIAHTGPDDTAEDPVWRRGSSVYDRLALVGAERLVLFLPSDRSAIEAAAKTLPIAVD
jgi:alkanesulfonate monooxygenase SsuD/methylene tetrahydromethanopterin reductase-like flavin-dependent oxidoreductase (luciferase family)